MARINWTAEAERWLKDIYDYIAEDNQDAAIRVVEGIYDRVQLLQKFPELGHKYDRKTRPAYSHFAVWTLSNCISHKAGRQHRYFRYIP